MQTVRATIKTILFTASTLGLYFFWFITHYFVPNKIHWRQSIFYWWTLSFAKISAMRLEIIGKPPKPPFFLVCNHLSIVDMSALRVAAKGVFVAKSEVNSWPVAGRIIRDMGTVFIDRQNRRDIPRAGEEIIKRLDDGEGVIVFPEGTSTKGETVLPFNSSFLQFAAVKNIPVSYASISYQTPPGDMPANQAVCWWEDISFFEHLWRIFKQREYTAVINFGDEPIMRSDRKELANELRDRVAETFVPVL